MKKLLLVLLASCLLPPASRLMAQGLVSDLTVQRTVKLTGDVTPSQITANQNDYDPTSLSTAAVLRISSDAARSITGLAGGSDGRQLWLVNVGSFAITLTNESGSSTAANRFGFGLDHLLAAKNATLLLYDATAARWREAGSTADLSALNASNLTSGTVPDARFPATLPAASGVNLTALNASNLASGTVAVARGGTGAGTAAGALDSLITAEASVASATTTDLGAVTSRNVSITGTTTITGFGTVAAGVMRFGRFAGALTLTHNATSLILPNAGSNITTAANDRFSAVSLGSGNWLVYSYTKADGSALAGGVGGANTQVLYNNGGASGGISGATSNGTSMTFSSGNLNATSPNITPPLTLTASADSSVTINTSGGGNSSILNLSRSSSVKGLLAVAPGGGFIIGAADNDLSYVTNATSHVWSVDNGSTMAFHINSSAGQVIAEKTTASTSPTTGAFVVKGGAGVAGDLWVGDEVNAAGHIKSSHATAGLGYATGAGGTVAQATSKSTGVTLNKASGQITMDSASLAATTSVTFTLTNSAIAAADVVVVNLKSGHTAGSYDVIVDGVGSGSCQITLRNYSAGSLGEAVVLTFAVIKAVTS